MNYDTDSDSDTTMDKLNIKLERERQRRRRHQSRTQLLHEKRNMNSPGPCPTASTSATTTSTTSTRPSYLNRNMVSLYKYFPPAVEIEQNHNIMCPSRKSTSWRSQILNKFDEDVIVRGICEFMFAFMLMMALMELCSVVTQEHITATLKLIERLVNYLTYTSFADIFGIDFSWIFVYQEDVEEETLFV